MPLATAVTPRGGIKNYFRLKVQPFSTLLFQFLLLKVLSGVSCKQKLHLHSVFLTKTHCVSLSPSVLPSKTFSNPILEVIQIQHCLHPCLQTCSLPVVKSIMLNTGEVYMSIQSPDENINIGQFCWTLDKLKGMYLLQRYLCMATTARLGKNGGYEKKQQLGF